MSSGHTQLINSTDQSGSAGTCLGFGFSNNIGPRLSLSGSTNSVLLTPVSPTTVRKLTVHLHGKNPEECTDLNLTAEDLCVGILRKHFPLIGPAAVNLFSLAVIDLKHVPKCVWKCPTTDLKELEQSLQNRSSAKLYLRIRFLPAKDRVDNLKKLGHDVIKYLYHQCRDDFVSERFKTVFGSKKSLTSAKSRGLAVLDLLITARSQDKSVEKFLETVQLKEFLPRPELLDLWKKMKLKKNMKSHLLRFDKNHPQETTGQEELMLGYIKDIVKEVIEYSVEQYEAKMVDNNNTYNIKIVVDIHHEPAGVRFDEDFFSRIEGLNYAHLTPSYQQQDSSWKVHLDRSDGRPAVMGFESYEVAESFVSCLDGYHRLLKDYYFNICPNMVPPSLKMLNAIKSHGPIDNEFAVEKIKKKLDDQDSYYLYKQDISEFNTFTVVYCKNGQARTETMKRDSHGEFYLTSNESQRSDDPAKLIKQHGDRDLLPTNLMRLRPNSGESCSVLRRLFKDDDPIPDDSGSESADTKSRQPMLYMESDLQLKDIIDNGWFTQVHKAQLKNESVVAVKVLRMANVKQEQIFNSTKPFQNSIIHHMLFNEPSFFVGILGLCLTSSPRSSPVMMIMDYAPYGSLSKFFKTRKPSQPIYLEHLVYTADQVAQGLYYLEEHNLHHGNVCCHNILVFRYEMGYISVKLGDPGMTMLYDTILLSHDVNQRRLPWIAPELMSTVAVLNTKKPSTLQSDIYAFGATILEMFGQGANPMDSEPLKSKTPAEAVDFFKQKGWISLPRPEDLKVKEKVEKVDGKDTMVPAGKLDECKLKIHRLVTRCMSPDPKDRPYAKEIVRDLHTLGSEYGATYHAYEYVYSERDPTPLWTSGETSILDDSSRDTVPDLTGSFQSDGDDRLSIVLPENPVKKVDSTSTTLAQREITPKRMLPPHPSRFSLNQRPPIPTPCPGSIEDIKYLIDSNKLDFSMNVLLGQGHYGEVKKGTLKGYGNRPILVEVAAKCLKGEFKSVLDNEEFKQEATIMAQLTHENIVKFYGISNDKIIMEFVNNGAMSMYLRKRKKERKPLGVIQIMKIVKDIVMGMEHLAEKRIVHSDLAGRNVLLTDNLQAKISDFGLARNLGEKDYYRRSKEKELPAMWCAPEGLEYQKFTSKGDVWSFGIVVWEALSHGRRPYSDEKENEKEKFNFKLEGLDMLRSGHRMKMPPLCPHNVAEMTLRCWEFDPEKRPSFTKLKEECSEFLTELQSRPSSIPNPGMMTHFLVGHASIPLPANPFGSEPSQCPDNPQKSDPARPQAGDQGHNDDIQARNDLESQQFDRGQSAALEPAATVEGLPREFSDNSVSGGLGSTTATTEVPQQITSNGPSSEVIVSTAEVPQMEQITSNGPSSEVTASTTKVSQMEQITSNGPSSEVIASTAARSKVLLREISRDSTKSTTDQAQSSEAHINHTRPLPDCPSIFAIKFLINANDVSVTDVCLGKGQLGVVHIGKYKTEQVAVKTLDKQFHDKTKTDEFSSEVEILSQVDHPQIVKFYGFCLREHMMVMELVECGSLEARLKSCNRLTPKQTLSIITDIANGMKYLSERKIIHCDLAARNILLTESCRAKISDFGLSKILDKNKDYYRRSQNKPMSFWWAAPECIESLKFSAQSDVWSFGLVVWESFSHGNHPETLIVGRDYHDKTKVVPVFLTVIKEGVRWQKPENCDEDVYALMLSCWKSDPKDRPTFADICEKCLNLHDKVSHSDS